MCQLATRIPSCPMPNKQWLAPETDDFQVQNHLYLNPSLIIFQCFEGVNFLFFSYQSVEFPSTFLDIFWLQIFVDFFQAWGQADRPRQEVSGVWPSKTCRTSGAFASNSDAWNGNCYTNDLCGVGSWLFEVRRETFPEQSVYTIHGTGRFIFLHLSHESTKGRHTYQSHGWYGMGIVSFWIHYPYVKRIPVFIPNNQRFMLRIQHKTHKNRISFLFNWPFAIQLT